MTEKTPINRLHQELPALFALAYERSESARLELAGKLANLFLAENIVLTDSEARVLNDLIEELLKIKNPVIRHELAQKFAAAHHMPRQLAINLAYKPIDVAAAILINNQSFTDDDLIQLVDTETTDHACAIAQRKAVSEAVADALVATGSLDVMKTVTENLGAKLSAKAITVLSEAARLAEPLQQPLMYRPELSTEVALRLFWWVGQDLRRYALQRFGIPSGQIDQELQKVVEQKLQDHMLERFDDAAMEKVAAWLDERKIMPGTLFTQILRMGHFRLFTQLLSRMTKLQPVLVEKIVGDPGGRLMAVLCRAFLIDKATFVSIFLLARGARSDEQIVHPSELSLALGAFERLSAQNAQDLLLTWQRNPEYLTARQDDDVEFDK